MPIQGQLLCASVSLTNATLAAELNRLTPAKTLELVQERWDDIEASPQEVPIPQWHTNELSRRLDNDAEDKGRLWEQVRDDILGR